MELIITKEDTTKKLPKDETENIKSKIVKMYDKWDEERQAQRTQAEDIQKAIYDIETKKDKKGHVTDTTLANIYELSETIKAHISNNITKNPNTMFDVKGEDSVSKANEKLQKAQIVSSLEKGKFKDEVNKSINFLIDRGEAIHYVGWKTEKKQIRRKVENIVPVYDDFGEVVNAKKEYSYEIQEKKIFNGAYIKSIDPLNFVYDVNKSDNWLSCPKVYKSFQTLEELKSNKVYKLSKSDDEKLTQGIDTDIKEKDSSDTDDVENDNTKAFKGDMIEILEFWGDFKLKDGTVLNNYVITVAGRCSIIRFEANPYLNCPFTQPCALITHPDYKRGISILNVALPYEDIQNDLICTELKALRLIINPPYLAPKGSLNGEIKLKEGAIIEYDPALMPQAPREIGNFKDALVAGQYGERFKAGVQNATGIQPNMSGNFDNTKKLATEIQATVNGQSVRMSKANDTINHKLIIPSIKLHAEMTANYNFDDEEILYNQDGDYILQTVTADIRQGNYRYIYGDRDAIQERKMRFKETFDYIKMLIGNQLTAPMIDIQEAVKYGFEQLNIEDTERFIRKNDIQTAHAGMPNAGIMPSGAVNGLQQPQGIPQGMGIPPA